MSRTALNLAISVGIYSLAVAVIVYSFSIFRHTGGGMGVPGAILQPLAFLTAAGLTAVCGVVYVVLAVIAIANKRDGMGCALHGLAVFVLVVNVAQLLFNVFVPDF